jgi:hypothetical protein
MSKPDDRRFQRAVKKAVRDRMSEIGAMGGSAGRGEKKRRGGGAHYSAMAKKRWDKR